MTVIIILGVIALTLIISLGFTALATWAVIELLKLLGIATIAFSWKLVILVAIIITALKSIFGTTIKVNKD